MFMCFFQPLIFWDRIPFNVVFRVLLVVVWFAIIITEIVRIRKWDSYLWLWTIFCGIQIAIIQINASADGAEPWNATLKVISYLFLVHFLDAFLSKARTSEIKFFWRYLFGMTVLELISIPLYKLGIISIYWYGIKTRATEPIIAMILVGLLLKDELSKKELYSGIGIGVIVSLWLKNSTAIIGLLLIWLCYTVQQKRKFKWLLKILKPHFIVAVTAALSIGVVFFGIQTNFSTLWSMAFGKDITFSGRTGIWAAGMDAMINYDQAHRLWGFGFSNVSLWCKMVWWNITTEGHNQIFQMLHDTGYIGTIIMYVVWFLQLRNTNKCEDNYIKYITVSTCFAMLIMCITEIYCYHSYYYILFAIAARSTDIARKLEISQKERV